MGRKFLIYVVGEKYCHYRPHKAGEKPNYQRVAKRISKGIKLNQLGPNTLKIIKPNPFELRGGVIIILERQQEAIEVHPNVKDQKLCHRKNKHQYMKT